MLPPHRYQLTLILLEIINSYPNANLHQACWSELVETPRPRIASMRQTARATQLYLLRPFKEHVCQMRKQEAPPVPLERSSPRKQILSISCLTQCLSTPPMAH